MRADEFINSDEKLDEILPLIGMAARSVAGMAAKNIGKAAVGAAAQKIGQKVSGMSGSQAQPTVPGDNKNLKTQKNSSFMTTSFKSTCKERRRNADWSQFRQRN